MEITLFESNSELIIKNKILTHNPQTRESIITFNVLSKEFDININRKKDITTFIKIKKDTKSNG